MISYMHNTIIHIGKKAMHGMAFIEPMHYNKHHYIETYPWLFSLARVLWYLINLGCDLFLLDSDVTPCSGMQLVWLQLQIIIRTGLSRHQDTTPDSTKYTIIIWTVRVGYITQLTCLRIPKINNLKTIINILHMMAISH